MNIQKILGITIICLAISTLAWAQPQGSPAAATPSGASNVKIEGAYQAVLTFPKAQPTAILVFCPNGEPFSGVWVEDGGAKFVGDMYDKSINGDELSFTVKAGPGVWKFVCTIDGKTMKGTVTGDGATSPFEGPRVELDKDFCKK